MTASARDKIDQFDINDDVAADVCDPLYTHVFDKVIHKNCCVNRLQPYSCNSIQYDASTNNDSTSKINYVSQQSHEFGFCPLGPLESYVGESPQWEQVPHVLEAHHLVRNSGKPNFLSCRIPVESHLNISSWLSYLVNYWDTQLLDLLQYGFPLDFCRKQKFSSTEINHTSALQNLDHVSDYVQEELSYRAMIGPFDHKPVPLHVSPLMVRDKQTLIKAGHYGPQLAPWGFS